MTLSKRSYVSGSWITLMNGARPVPVPSRYRCLPGSRSLRISVPVGLRLTFSSSPGCRCCRREVSGPFGTLMLKNSRCSS
ncbi:hypothetical protein D3C75_1244740 [compost metagenome]